MFTSEHWRRLRDTSRPRLVFSAGLGLAFAVTLVVCTRALAVWTSDQNYRIQAVNALGPETRVLITGSSHVFATLNPALIHIPSMNLAAPVCSYVCVEGIVRGNLAKVPQLEALVIELDVVPLFYDTLRAYGGDPRPLLELDPDLFAMAISPWEKYELWRDRTLERSFLGPLFRPGKVTPAQALPRFRGERRSEDPVVAPGYANGPEVMSADDTGAARVAQHLREAGDLAELPRNEAALRRVLQLGRERQLKLALLRFPHHPSYWAALPVAWQQELDALLARLEQDLPGSFVYWDFGELPWLLDTDYRNGDHINDNATARVSAAFEQKLESWLGGATSRADNPRLERTMSATDDRATLH
ncbi:MAG: hypothetical protein RL033_1968 [Pseudomonadota bacterium]